MTMSILFWWFGVAHTLNLTYLSSSVLSSGYAIDLSELEVSITSYVDDSPMQKIDLISAGLFISSVYEHAFISANVAIQLNAYLDCRTAFCGSNGAPNVVAGYLSDLDPSNENNPGKVYYNVNQYGITVSYDSVEFYGQNTPSSLSSFSVTAFRSGKIIIDTLEYQSYSNGISGIVLPTDDCSQEALAVSIDLTDESVVNRGSWKTTAMPPRGIYPHKSKFDHETSFVACPVSREWCMTPPGGNLFGVLSAFNQQAKSSNSTVIRQYLQNVVNIHGVAVVSLALEFDFSVFLTSLWFSCPYSSHFTNPLIDLDSTIINDNYMPGLDISRENVSFSFYCRFGNDSHFAVVPAFMQSTSASDILGDDRYVWYSSRFSCSLPPSPFGVDGLIQHDLFQTQDNSVQLLYSSYVGNDDKNAVCNVETPSANITMLGGFWDPCWMFLYSYPAIAAIRRSDAEAESQMQNLSSTVEFMFNGVYGIDDCSSSNYAGVSRLIGVYECELLAQSLLNPFPSSQSSSVFDFTYTLIESMDSYDDDDALLDIYIAALANQSCSSNYDTVTAFPRSNETFPNIESYVVNSASCNSMMAEVDNQFLQSLSINPTAVATETTISEVITSSCWVCGLPAAAKCLSVTNSLFACGGSVDNSLLYLPHENLDCNGVCRGPAAVDYNGDCCADVDLIDCSGICQGPYTIANENVDKVLPYDDLVCCSNTASEVVDCAGVCDGNAIIDSCETCSGGNTGFDPDLTGSFCPQDTTVSITSPDYNGSVVNPSSTFADVWFNLSLHDTSIKSNQMATITVSIDHFQAGTSAYVQFSLGYRDPLTGNDIQINDDSSSTIVPLVLSVDPATHVNSSRFPIACEMSNVSSSCSIVLSLSLLGLTSGAANSWAVKYLIITSGTNQNLLDPFASYSVYSRHDFILHARTIDCDYNSDIACSMAPGCSYCVSSIGLRMLQALNDPKGLSGSVSGQRQLLNDIFPMLYYSETGSELDAYCTFGWTPSEVCDKTKISQDALVISTTEFSYVQHRKSSDMVLIRSESPSYDQQQVWLLVSLASCVFVIPVIMAYLYHASRL